MKDSAVKENKGKSGVYRWTNIISNKTFASSSLCTIANNCTHAADEVVLI